MIVIQILQHLLTRLPLVKQIMRWSKHEGFQLHRHIQRTVCAMLLLLNSSLATPERLLAKLHAWLSNMLSVMPSGVLRPQDGAVVILGDIDGTGLGRAAALSFSELGYTVFMLSTSNSGGDPSGESEKSSAVLSLLYAWHKRKERSPAADWGTVAPITLDTHSAAQRTHASETVHAYCEDHALQLCALIVLPPPSPARRSPAARPQAHVPIKASAGDGRAATMWTEDLEAASREPIAIVRDYFDLLTKASGRVVLMSRCLPHNTEGVDHLLDGTRECLAINLNQSLASVGVRVCSLTTGAPEDFGEYRFSPSKHHNGQTSSAELCPITEPITLGLSYTDDTPMETPYYTAVCDVLQSIACAAYPRTTYTVGYRPWLAWAWRVAPDAVRLLCISPIIQKFRGLCCSG